MEHFFRDVRQGVRSLGKHRAMSALAILALAIGIGTVTTQFSVVRSVLHRGLPYPGASALHAIDWAGLEEQRLDTGIAIQDLAELQRQQTSFEALIGYYSGTVNLRSDDAPIRLQGAFVSAGWLTQLKVSPALGRGFEPGEDQPGAATVVLLSHAVWQRDFGGAPDVLGRSVHANGRPGTIVGIMPEGFSFPGSEQVWLPLAHDEVAVPRGKGRMPTLGVFGRLRPGVSADAAGAELTAIAARLRVDHPETNKNFTAVRVRPIIDQFADNDLRGMLWTMLLAAFLVLGVACANVANLLLAQAAQRTKELAVRSALGAGRGRLVVQMLTEALVLATIGAVLGVGLAHLGIAVIWSEVEKLNPPSWMQFAIEGPVLVFVVVVTFVTTLLSGLVPALQASRTDVNGILKDDARTSSGLHLGRFARVLVVAQIALSCGLIATALLMAKMGRELRSIEFPYEPAEIFSARLGLFDGDYPSDADRVRFYQRLGDVLAAEPGVATVAFSGNYRFFGSGRSPVRLDDGTTYEDEKDMPRVRREIIGGDYFSLLRSALLEGRNFNAADFEPEAPRVAVVNEAFARRFFSGRSPIGARFAQGRGPESAWMTIVGVAPNLRMQGVDAAPEDGAGYYVPFSQDVPRFMTVLLRARAGDPATLAALLRRQLAPLDPNLPIYEAVTLDRHIVERMRGYNIFADIFAGLGIAALFLASMGVYGVMSFAVNQRRHEFGIRMALGASGREILRMVFVQGGRQVLVGIGAGLLLAFGLGKLIAAFLENLPAYDPLVYVAVVVALGSVGLVAIWAPARRAAGVSPTQALRDG